MASYWGLPSIVVGGSLLNINRHYEVFFYDKKLDAIGVGEEEGEIDEAVSESSEEETEIQQSIENKPAKTTVPIIVKPFVPSTSVDLSRQTASEKSKTPPEEEEEEEGAISSGSEDSYDSEEENEKKRRTQAEAEVREMIMAKGIVKKSTVESGVKTAASEVAPVKGEKRKATNDLPQMKSEPSGPKKPVKQLPCYSEKDVDYRAIWQEQTDATKVPSNHPFFQLSVRNVRTKPYCDLWESEEKKDYLYYKPGTWDHIKDIPRLTEDNLSKLSIAEAKQFVTWLLAERKVANSELMSLRRRFWAESDRHRRFKGYVTGQRKLPSSASAAKLAAATSNSTTLISPEGLLVVAPKEQKRLLQGISKLWMTEATSDLLKQKQRVYAKMKKRGTEFFKNKFKELDRLCRIEVRKAKQHWESYMMDCIRQNGIIVGNILEECIDRVASGNIPPDRRVLLAQQRRFWNSQRGGGPAWAKRGGHRLQRGKSRADQLQL